MNAKRPAVSRLDYCQYLLSSQINYTLANFAEHAQQFSHDQINRSLAGERIAPHLVWETMQSQVVLAPDGYLIFDDTVADKHYSRQMAVVRRQWSGNAHRVIRGIGIVTCVYLNPQTQQFWIIDYRIYDPDSDGKSKLDHMHEMLMNVVHQKRLAVQTVLMDTWYATQDAMLTLERLAKRYCCPLKDNRQVDDSGGARPYQRVDSLHWTADEWAHGKLVKLKGFPKDHKVKLFRVTLSTQRTEYIVTNDLTQDDTAAIQQAIGWRWKIEQFHRETKQVTGLEGCQCRTARIIRNHVGCAILVWVRLKQVAADTRQTIYQVKHGLLADYLRQQLKSPSVKMVLA